MTTFASTHPTLFDAAFGGRRSALQSVLLAVAGTALLWASAKVQIPFFPVPMTMQTFVVLFLGFALGSRLGAATVLLYLAEGALGLPVFAGTPEKGLGLAYMAGPTGGFLAGFVVAAYVTGWFAERGFDRHLLTAGIAALAGLASVYALGLTWLGTLIGWDKPVLEFGLYPFLPAEALKFALLAAILPLAWRGVSKR
ncbi:biotin transporter BioY [Oricola sp.]|uniref:biotin transporter BioY n=1 Tax=Oricola sp. TaxID=1979950 RepID=UPI0025D76639|nr:biotin transporter BioY [Oricola sp.]MCI5074542.1 biotin transporter BioY [Oricola sp.]